MSRSLVRAAVYSYLNAPAVPGVDWVFPGIPYDQAGVAWDDITAPGQTSRCFIVVHLDDSDDYGQRVIIFDGAGGRRLVHYPVTLAVYFEDISGDPLAALTSQELALDNLQARLRADPSMGQPAATGWISAAFPDLKVSPGVLARLGEGDTFSSWSELSFTAVLYEYST